MKDALDRDGWFLLSRALDDAWLARLRRAFDSAPQRDGTQHVRLDEATPELAAWRALETLPGAIAAAEHVLAGPCRVRDLHGRNPLPGFGQQGLHADWMPRAAPAPYFVATAIVMIDDFTVENGATRVVPGTHRVAAPIAKPLAQPNAVHAREVVVTGRAGDALVFNGHLWHSGRRNDSRGPRRAAQMVFVSPGNAR